MWSYMASIWAWLMGPTVPPVEGHTVKKLTEEQLKNLPKMEPADVQMLRDVWKLVEPDPTQHGVEILIRLFDKYPETKEKFPRLNVSSPEVMRKSARVKAHGGRVVVSLGGIIAQLDEPDLVDETIFLLGDSHQKRGVTPADFQKFSTVLLAYLKEALGDALPPEAEAAYGKLMEIFNAKMSQHL